MTERQAQQPAFAIRFATGPSGALSASCGRPVLDHQPFAFVARGRVPQLLLRLRRLSLAPEVVPLSESINGNRPTVYLSVTCLGLLSAPLRSYPVDPRHVADGATARVRREDGGGPFESFLFPPATFAKAYDKVLTLLQVRARDTRTHRRQSRSSASAFRLSPRTRASSATRAVGGVGSLARAQVLQRCVTARASLGPRAGALPAAVDVQMSLLAHPTQEERALSIAGHVPVASASPHPSRRLPNLAPRGSPHRRCAMGWRRAWRAAMCALPSYSSMAVVRNPMIASDCP